MKSKIVRVFMFLLLVVLIISFSSNPPDGNTGAPFNGICSNCHNSPPPGVFGNITISGLPATVMPNTNYSITLTGNVTSGSPLVAGFQLVAVDENQANTGDLVVTQSGTGTDLSGGREYIEHRGPHPITGGTVSFMFDWMSPGSAPGNGEITFYTAMNLANNNGNNGGDRIISNNFSTTLQGGGPTLAVTIISSTDVSCNGGGDGSATAQASGGTPPYNYVWSNGQTGPNAINLSAGSYSVTVTDLDGDAASASVTINEPPALTVNVVNITNVDCFGNATGSATVNASGGTPGYSYSWSDGQSGQTASSLAAGAYTVMVTDANGCTTTESITITEPPPLQLFTLAIQHVDCNGNATGSATVAGTGGTPGYSYTWSDGQSGQTASSLIAGTYSVTIIDANACTNSISVTITEPPSLVASISMSTNVSCSGGNTGSATAQATGGTSPYSYDWSNGANTQTASNLSAGAYIVTITDDNDCTDTAQVTITEPTPLVLGATTTDASCGSACDGSIDLTPEGGTPPYDFQWSNGDTTENVSGLCAGNYVVTVTDANSCTTITVETIGQASSFTLTATTIPGTCLDTCGGSIDLQVTGGNPPFSFQWSTGDTTEDISGLCGGTYMVAVADSTGCGDSLTVTLPTISPFTIFTGGTDETSFNANDGTAYALPMAGNGPYTFLWSNGGTTDTITGLSPGAYFVTVTDSIGCVDSGSVVVAPFICTMATQITTTGASCYGDSTGSATVSITGANLPLTALLWSGGGTDTTEAGLPAGTYTVTVTDSKNCTVTDTAIITQPAMLELNLDSAAHILCHGDSTGYLEVTTQGGTSPSTYQWSTGETDSIQSGLPAGTYSVTVTDANGCTDTLTQTLTEPPPLTVNATITGESKAGGNDATATANPSGGVSPYSYAWNTGDTTAIIDSLSPGTYSVTVTDSNGCTASQSVLINAFNCTLEATANGADVLCQGDSTGMVQVSTNGGNPPLTYSWSSGDTSAVVNGLPAGTYTVMVQDSSNCSAIDTVMIGEPAVLTAQVDSLEGVACFGDSTGAITVSASGGVGGYSFNWSNGESGPSISGLKAGTYTVSVTDTNNCLVALEVVVPQNLRLLVNASATGESSSGANDGTATANPAGGVLPYTYLWNTGDTSMIISNLAPGIYTVIVTDSAGCTAADTVTVDSFNCDLEIQEAEVSSVLCAGANDGSIDIETAGGTQPFTFSWSNGDTTATIDSLMPGIYSLMITDVNNCSASDSFIISEPPPLITSLAAIVHPECAGDNDGSITVATSGGTPPYSYNWNTGDTTAQLGMLGPGFYEVAITDANGCFGTQAAEIVIADTILPVTRLKDITIYVDASGMATIEASDLDDGSTDNCQVDTQYVDISTFDCSSLGDNKVIVATVDNNNNCSFDSATVSVLDTLPPKLICPGDTVIFNCDGLATYEVDFGDNCDLMGALPELTSGLGSGESFPIGTTTESYSIRDVAGNQSTCSFTITVENTLDVRITDSVPTCPGENFGNATVSVTGGTPEYTYLWNDPAMQNRRKATGLAAGSYTVTVTDSTGCTDSAMVTILAFPEIIVEVDTVINDLNGTGVGAIEITVDGAGPFSFEWSTGGMVVSLVEDPVGLEAGDYVLRVVDANGCELISDTVTVDNVVATRPVPAAGRLKIFPNPTDGLVKIVLREATSENLQVKIFNQFGALMLSTDRIAVNGKMELDMSSLAGGVYVVQLQTADGVYVERLVLQR